MASPREQMSVAEFASLVALLTSLIALSIDAMLPALPQIAADLAVGNPNDTQLVIGLFLLGNAFGQLLFGPLSDTLGRKPVIVAGKASIEEAKIGGMTPAVFIFRGRCDD